VRHPGVWLWAAALLVEAVAAAPVLSAAPNAPGAERAVAARETTPAEAEGDSVDDPAIWVDPAEPSRSVVIGANHLEKTLEVYDLSGARLQRVAVRAANNVDGRTGFPLGGSQVALFGTGGGGDNSGKISLWRLDPATRRLSNVTTGGTIRTGAAYGFCMYRSGTSGRFYAFSLGRGGKVEQWELFDDGGMVSGRLARTIDVNPAPVAERGGDALEACATDDRSGALYVGEEKRGIWRYDAEPDAPAGAGDRTLVDSADGRGHLVADVEGIAVLDVPGSDGFLLASSQGDYTFNVYRRSPPHEFIRKVSVVGGTGADGCDRTDGIDAVATGLGPDFPRGLFVCQDNVNSDPDANQNFKYVPLEQVVPPGSG
jgi:myo-inositol-hexaphosphate 3-phosphohydrolase